MFGARVDARLEPAAALGLQQTDDSVVFELLADGPHQNRTHQTPPTSWNGKIKRESLTWINQAPVTLLAVWSDDPPHIVGYNARVSSEGAAPVPGKILIVDDDEVVTQTFARMLRLEGYQVRTAITAENGLHMAQESQPDAI